MKTKFLLIGVIGLIGLGVAGSVAWYLISPLFIDNVVDEAFPFEVPSQTELAAMSEAERMEMEAKFMEAAPSEAELASLSPDQVEMVEAKVSQAAAVVMNDKMVEDDMPETAAAEWVLAGQGQFAGADGFHQGSGLASLFQQGDASVLRFEDFNVTNGPDLHVLLIENPNATGRSDMGETIDLGKLKGNMGNQNYDIPPGTDLSKFRGVMIYCMPFHVVFATAPLS
jgi:hypothetical protein